MITLYIAQEADPNTQLPLTPVGGGGEAPLDCVTIDVIGGVTWQNVHDGKKGTCQKVTLGSDGFMQQILIIFLRGIEALVPPCM